jgi:hypothetical protein
MSMLQTTRALETLCLNPNLMSIQQTTKSKRQATSPSHHCLCPLLPHAAASLALAPWTPARMTECVRVRETGGRRKRERLLVGDHLDEADGGEDREHSTAGGGTPGLQGKLVVELRPGKVDHLLFPKQTDRQTDTFIFSTPSRYSCMSR